MEIKRSDKMKTISALEKLLQAKLNKIAPGSHWEKYQSSERGEQRLLGPHIVVNVPVEVYKPILRELIGQLFFKYHSNIVGTKLDGIMGYASSPQQYRRIVLIQEEK